MGFGKVVREKRISRGMTQAALAHASGVSIAFLQLIEAGKANPSLDVCSALGSPLGFELKIHVKPADWDQVAIHGAPLLSREPSPHSNPTAETLLNSLWAACQELSTTSEIPDRERKTAAISALCWAIQTEFPSFFRKHLARSPLFEGFLPKQPNGALIKLRRQAAATLSTYL